MVMGDLVMREMKFNKELYSKLALIKAAYNYTDVAYVHLDSDDTYYYVSIENKEQGQEVNEQEFINEMLAQSVRHEIYQQTKNIRELLLARAMATSVIVEDGLEENNEVYASFDEDEILKDWFVANEES
jgi:His-Xaa-Ser system protein HxsD